MEALKAIYEEDFRIMNEREKSLRVTIRSDDHSLSLDLLEREGGRERGEGEREGGREGEREGKRVRGRYSMLYVSLHRSSDYPMTSPPIYEIK